MEQLIGECELFDEIEECLVLGGDNPATEEAMFDSFIRVTATEKEMPSQFYVDKMNQWLATNTTSEIRVAQVDFPEGWGVDDVWWRTSKA